VGIYRAKIHSPNLLRAKLSCERAVVKVASAPVATAARDNNQRHFSSLSFLRSNIKGSKSAIYHGNDISPKPPGLQCVAQRENTHTKKLMMRVFRLAATEKISSVSFLLSARSYYV